MRFARLVTLLPPAHHPLVLTAHGSADPRSAASAHEVAHTIRMVRRDVDVRVAFCEQNTPNLRDVLSASPRDAVVVPLLLADAYHARVDIPTMIDESGSAARQADVLGEDDRLVSRSASAPRTRRGVATRPRRWRSRHSGGFFARPQANARTASVADYLAQNTRWTATIAFATGPHPSLAEAADVLRDRGATRLIVAPWFLAHGRITDRVANFARTNGIAMAEPLGPHRLVAETVLDRFDEAVATRVAA